MRAVLHVLLSAILLTAGTARCNQAASDVFDLPQLTGITIDGTDKDWGNRGFGVELMEWMGGPSPGPMPRFRAGWDTKGLLLLITVEDRNPREPAELKDLWMLDSVEIFAAGKRGSEEYYQLIFGPGMNAQQPLLRVFRNDMRKHRPQPLNVEAARHKQTGGYQLEVRLPWTNLGIIPAEGRELALQVMVNNNDLASTDFKSTGHAVWYPALGTWADSSRMYTVRLAPVASPSYLARARVVLNTQLFPAVELITAPSLIGTVCSMRVADTTVSGTVAAGGTNLQLPSNAMKGMRAEISNAKQQLTTVAIPDLAELYRIKESAITAITPMQPEKVLDALNLSLPGLEAVRTAHEAGARAKALQELLGYYRKRVDIEYDPKSHLDVIDPVTPELIKRAQDTIKHVFMPRVDLAEMGYKPANYGPQIDWDHNPHNNANWPATMHRFNWDQSLASAYVATGEERYAQGWVDLTRDWITKNPAGEKRKTIGYYALQLGVRCWRLPAGFELFKASSAFTPEFLAVFLAAVYDQAQVEALDPWSGDNNGTMVAADGLVRLAVVFPEFTIAPQWLKRGGALFAETCAAQVSNEGVQKEWSINYHMACATHVLNMVDFLKANKHTPPPTLATLAAKMYDYLFAAVSPDRLYPMFSDARRPSHAIDTHLRKGASVFDRPHYLAVLDSKAADYPKQLSYAFPESGMYFLRSGWGSNATYMAIHCSPKAASSHDQPDNGTFELYANGDWLMPDSGCYSYSHGNPEAVDRPWFCSTKVHQTLTLNDNNSVNASKHLLWVTEADFDVVAFENASYTHLTHRRTIFFVERKYFVVLDEALGNDEGTIAVHFQLTPGKAEINLEQHTARTLREKGGNVLIWQAADAAVSMAEEEGQVSYQFHKKEPRPAFAYQAKDKKTPVAFLTVIVPYAGTQAPEISATCKDGFVPGADTAEVMLTVDDTRWTLRRDLASGRAWSDKTE